MKTILIVLAILLVGAMGLAWASATISDNAAVIWQAQAAIEANKNAQTAVSALALRSALDGLLWVIILLAVVGVFGAWMKKRHLSPTLAQRSVLREREGAGPAPLRKMGQAEKMAKLMNLNPSQRETFLQFREALGDEMALNLALAEQPPQLAGPSQVEYQVVDDELEW